MKGAHILAIAALMVAVSPLAAYADDFFPPQWRGESGTTMQQWTFNTSANPTLANIDNNPYGDPTASITPSATTHWWNMWQGHQGVWKFEDFMYLDIPNTPIPNDTKYIWVQFTYYAAGGAMPQLYSDPGESMMDVVYPPVQIDPYFWHAAVQLTLHPNPSFERITIEPMDCTLYIDQVVVDTICFPEPSTLMLLALGAVAVLRRR